MRGATAPDYIPREWCISPTALRIEVKEGWSTVNIKGPSVTEISRPAPTAAVVAHIPEYQLGVMPHDGRVDPAQQANHQSEGCRTIAT